MRTLLAVFTVAVATLTGVAAQAPIATSAFSPPADLTAPPADAAKGPAGLLSKVVKPADSPEKPSANDVVTVQYTGWTSDGHMFDSTLSRSGPSMFPLTRALQGFRDCVLQMQLHETRRCWVPESAGFKGAAGKPKGTVVFDIELLDTRLSPTIAPPDVKEPPADAHREPTGLAYKVLRKGTGQRHPFAYSKVTVHYSGWTTDGKLFDSSIARGMPSTFDLGGGVIKGWTDGVQLMVEGERARLWIPQELAYKGEPGSPRGMLVFDIDLIKIE